MHTGSGSYSAQVLQARCDSYAGAKRSWYVGDPAGDSAYPFPFQIGETLSSTGPALARASSGAPAIKPLNKKMAISGPSLARASSAAPANKPLNKKMTISSPSLARASSGAPANKPLIRKLSFPAPVWPEPILVLLLISC